MRKRDWVIVVIITIVLVAAQIGFGIYVACLKSAIETGARCF